MGEANQTNAADLSPTATMFELIDGFRVSRTIYIAAKLGIADFLKEEPRTSKQLAHSTGTHAPSLYRVLRALASIGVLFGDDEKGFTLTPLGNTLRSDTPGSLGAWATLVLGDEIYRAWGDLMHSVETGESAFRHAFGFNRYDYVAGHLEHAKIFNQAMANLTEFYNTTVRDCYSFSGIGKVVDVGGGDGSLVIALLQANSGMQGIVFDLLQVAERAKHRISAAALENRCEVISGDHFVSVPSGGDIYILSRCVNSFDNDHAIHLLKNCRAVMSKKAKLLVIERLLGSRTEGSVVAQSPFMSDLHMMVLHTGRERTEAEHRGILEAASFRVMRVVPTRSEMSIIECVPL
jgi:hypothetical protein